MMNTLDRKVDGKTLLREQCYVCWMTPTDAPPPPGKTAADIRTEHFAYLRDLEHSGVLFAAGPFVDEDGVRHGAGGPVVDLDHAVGKANAQVE